MFTQSNTHPQPLFPQSNQPIIHKEKSTFTLLDSPGPIPPPNHPTGMEGIQGMAATNRKIEYCSS